MTYIVFCDGGSRGNPGPAGFGFVIYESSVDISALPKSPEEALKESKKVGEGYQYIGSTTNNQAEWQGLVVSLEYILKHFGPAQVRVYMDSQLVVRQMQGIYKVKNADLKPFHAKAQQYAYKLPRVEYVDIRREFNKEADALANLAMDNASKKV